MRHWHKIHREHHDLLICPCCAKNFEKLYFLTRHLEGDFHKQLAVSTEMAAKASVIKVPNKLQFSSGYSSANILGKTTTTKMRRTRIQHKPKHWKLAEKKERNRSRKERAKLEERFTGGRKQYKSERWGSRVWRGR